MATIRTSHTHPLQIAEVRASPSHGRIGITFCPGKHDRFAHTGAWERDLGIDLDTIAAWGAKLVLTLVEPAELVSLKVPQLGHEIHSRGMHWCHLPIADFSVPTKKFEAEWLTQGEAIRARLRNGEDVLVHCKGGLGRAGMMAARLLVELGMEPEASIHAVRHARKGAIETSAQLALVRRTVPIPARTILDTTTLQRVGGQKGSNPAGIFQDDDGKRYYVKTLESPAHARNEMIAAALYKLAGAPTLSYVHTQAPDQIATEWVELDKKCVAHLDASERKQAQQWLGVHAWTANWDAAGFDGDNQGVVNGHVLTLDVGGALDFRAHGDPKGAAFGTSVNEFEVMRSNADNPHAAKLFADMGREEIEQAIQKVLQIPDERIRQVIIENGGSEALAEKIIARKADMVSRAATMRTRL
ncbi:MAG: cyclin-dependent kinase inhibitor 3 family protein [Halothiobacillaceae bacterium]|nr:cyclin-dependent kinase inhibitor 3 family protein [Halothiobacillaceae bacterium]